MPGATETEFFERADMLAEMHREMAKPGSGKTQG
jgi:hypothetical protein